MTTQPDSFDAIVDDLNITAEAIRQAIGDAHKAALAELDTEATS